MKTVGALLPTAPGRRSRVTEWAYTSPRKNMRLAQWTDRSTNPDPRAAWTEPKPRQVTLTTRLLGVIEEARTILDLPQDWDDKGNKPFQLETWERVRQFLLDHAGLVWKRTGLIIPIPRIMPGPDGSIDLHWKTPRRELLLNVPENSSGAITYYGDDFGEDRIEGNIAAGALDPRLFTWLTVTD